jgi:hypothetical protein
MAAQTDTKGVQEMPKQGHWELVGEVGVDAGQIVICDPCYIYGSDNVIKDEVGGSEWEHWHQHLKDSGYFEPERRTLQIGQFLAVVSSSGFGDGVYPVMVRRTRGGDIAELKVVFIGDEA